MEESGLPHDEDSPRPTGGAVAGRDTTTPAPITGPAGGDLTLAETMQNLMRQNAMMQNFMMHQQQREEQREKDRQGQDQTLLAMQQQLIQLQQEMQRLKTDEQYRPSTPPATRPDITRKEVSTNLVELQSFTGAKEEGLSQDVHPDQGLEDTRRASRREGPVSKISQESLTTSQSLSDLNEIQSSSGGVEVMQKADTPHSEGSPEADRDTVIPATITGPTDEDVAALMQNYMMEQQLCEEQRKKERKQEQIKQQPQEQKRQEQKRRGQNQAEQKQRIQALQEQLRQLSEEKQGEVQPLEGKGENKQEKRDEKVLVSSVNPPTSPLKGISDAHQEKQEHKKIEKSLQGPASGAAEAKISKGPSLMELLALLGLENHYEKKLTISTVLEINAKTVSDEPLNTMESLPGAFLKRLMMANVNARGVKCEQSSEQEVPCYDIDNFEIGADDNNAINPTDLITALFLCSDGFLQQELVLKLSMCQFAVPFLLPNCDTKQSTLMLWAMREIVKKFRPSSQDSKSFIEERVVNSNIPMVSFVRLGECSLSKSQILNKLLSNPQQYHDTFVHHDMECGDAPRRISNGLVEMSWYLPCGNTNIDMFNTPVAVANLRGDITSFDKQFSFLCQTSSAVYIFCDDVEADLDILRDKNTKAELFLVVNSQGKAFKDTLKKITTAGYIKAQNVIVKKNRNDAEFMKSLQSCVGGNAARSHLTMEGMASIARQCGILVDEDNEECQRAKEMADAITSNITDTLEFKAKQLPLQGKVWKELSQLEKEQCRLRNSGNENIEVYKISLENKEKELRNTQESIDISDAMKNFLRGMSNQGLQRSYFLKWMRINLDNLSRQNLTHLREKYKFLCQNFPDEKKSIADLDHKLSDSSLGLEHFFRELAQLYESACSLPAYSPKRDQMEDLPGLCAQMLLDGFPIELVDGDASNIPLRWISEVLTHLHVLVDSNSKIKVVTVLGVQSTGKSTLLNTMFGVQFAVSSGRCTRGAFMLLIKADKDFKETLKCDYIMVIDTEGLKSPELAQLDDSHEHDNELATLVIGLSDVTIINIAMENATDMKDILQIVVHAFIRMKEVGKKPICHFVHQNVSDMFAHDNNMRARKKLLAQLDEMTLAAAKMERKENITKFTDVMRYDPDTSSCYIPGLWHGTPPMAPVNTGYSEAVYDLKKRLMKDFIDCKRNDNLTQFVQWTKDLWTSVKFEKFIFSFRNSLVADAYARLCNEYNGWEWSFQKKIYAWKMAAENKISNFGMADPNSQQLFADMLEDLNSEASAELSKGVKEIQDNLKKYFEKEDGHVNLVEKYKEDFVSSAKTLRRVTENTVRNKLQGSVKIKKGMTEVDKIKSSQADTIEKKVLDLLKNCKQRELSDEELREEFESMWKTTMSEIHFRGLPRQEVSTAVFNELRANLNTRGGNVNQLVLGNNLINCGQFPFIVESLVIKSGVKHWDSAQKRKKLQDFCDNIISQCQDFITLKVKSDGDYHDTYIRELLDIIDEKLSKRKRKLPEKCEVSLKLHICGIAARQFQEKHDEFITLNDPRTYLEQSKSKYSDDFFDLFYERNQCKKKAEEFTQLCLQPAVQDYVTKRIGPEIVEIMKTGQGSKNYSTRGSFQFSILEELLTKFDYKKYKMYIMNYEHFVKWWLFENIAIAVSNDSSSLSKLEKEQLSNIVKMITDTLSNRKAEMQKANAENDIKAFIQSFCSEFQRELVIPKDALDSFIRLNNANVAEFAGYLTESVQDMQKTLSAEYKNSLAIKKRLKSLPFKPHEEMFTSLFGCGKQCPFCKVPCEAGGDSHSTHFSSIHRPKGLTGWRNRDTNCLAFDICSSSVLKSDLVFITDQTGKDGHPYNDYKKYYPDWEIQGDSSTESTVYWKYVMAQFNETIAAEFGTNPARIPTEWNSLKAEHAMTNLKQSFNMT